LLAPILVFTTDEAWRHFDGEMASVHLADFPERRPDWKAPELAKRWRKMLEIRSDVSRGLEVARQAKAIGHSLDAAVQIYPRGDEVRALLERYADVLCEWLIVSDCELVSDPPSEDAIASHSDLVDVHVAAAPHPKCERCWQRRVSVGQTAERTPICARCSEVMRRIG
jgi:isoleucyl-tRNA synthetase